VEIYKFYQIFPNSLLNVPLQFLQNYQGGCVKVDDWLSIVPTRLERGTSSATAAGGETSKNTIEGGGKSDGLESGQMQTRADL